MKRFTALIICIMLLLTGCASQIQAKELAVAEYPEKTEVYDLKTDPTGNAEFVKKLTSVVLDGDENQVISPANIYFALAMLAETANGNTRDQILDLLEKDDIAALRKNTPLLWKKLYKKDENITSVVANSLWLNENYTNNYNKKTFDNLKNKYFASAYNGDFGDGAFVKQIRDWINEQTGGLLEKSANNLEYTPETVMTLVSALYYKAPWQKEFKPVNNKEDVFHSKNGDVDVEYMIGSASDIIYYSDKFTSAIKTFTDGNMQFILPNKEYTVEDILNDEKTLELIAGNHAAVENKSTTVYLYTPKFDVSFDTDLAEPLKMLGITDAFESEKADFSPIGEVEGVCVDRVNHASRVMIDEQGVKAAAYTALTLEEELDVPLEEVHFILDRPFIFVVSGEDNLPRFVGIVNNP